MTDRLKSICSMILDKHPKTSNIVLQKLLYLIQAASLIYLKKEAFADSIYAWEYGPVIPGIYNEFKNEDTVHLESDLVDIINIIVDNLISMNAFDLVDMVLSYKSWRNAWNRRPGSLISTYDIIKCHKEISIQRDGFIF